MIKNTLPDETKIRIDHPDTKETKIVTLGQVREFLKSEPYEWRDRFFALLEKSGSAYGRIAKYSLLNKPDKKDATRTI